MSYNREAYEQVHAVDQPTEEHKATWSHELIGGAAAFEAMRLYEQKAEKEGKQDDHAFAKEILAGIAGASVDGLIESKGLNFIDREKAKRHATQEAEKLYKERTGYTGGF
ncbi:hypothetical protein INT44_006656 [Umbelopsis vinacea]|uniref:CipC protein n=1 Tax=Umbelopsis vinacea TaxID=44442 RepID=A0A8H7PEM2_9FUNG|nr:hypothetical protein INT44_006656 [Umbelopsis vinacea]KAI9287665.1 CipC protein [Umbelopsis sp. AD052]